MRTTPRRWNRPAVTLTGSVSREWRDKVPVTDLAVGDLVDGEGTIVNIWPQPDPYRALDIEFFSGDCVRYDVEVRVRAAIPR